MHDGDVCTFSRTGLIGRDGTFVQAWDPFSLKAALEVFYGELYQDVRTE